MNQNELQNIRKQYQKFKRVGNAVFYETYYNRGYNNTTYSVARIFGKPPTRQEMIDGFGGNEWCGGIMYNNKKVEECDFGEVFSFTIPGCD